MFFSYDFVYIYDGDRIFASEIGSLTGNILPGEIVSTGADIFINLISDFSEAMTGFKIQYAAGNKYYISSIKHITTNLSIKNLTLILLLALDYKYMFGLIL